MYVVVPTRTAVLVAKRRRILAEYNHSHSHNNRPLRSEHLRAYAGRRISHREVERRVLQAIPQHIMRNILLTNRAYSHNCIMRVRNFGSDMCLEEHRGCQPLLEFPDREHLEQDRITQYVTALVSERKQPLG